MLEIFSKMSHFTTLRAKRARFIPFLFYDEIHIFLEFTFSKGLEFQMRLFCTIFQTLCCWNDIFMRLITKVTFSCKNHQEDWLCGDILNI